MCTFISVSYKKHKGKHFGVKAISTSVSHEYWFGAYLHQLNNSQILLDLGVNRVTVAIPLLQKLYLCTYQTVQYALCILEMQSSKPYLQEAATRKRSVFTVSPNTAFFVYIFRGIYAYDNL